MTATCWTLPCELITPAFLGGAEPNEQAAPRRTRQTASTCARGSTTG